MRIAVVAYEMEGTATGVGRYLEGLLGGLAELRRDDTWRLFFKGDPFAHPLWSAPPAGGPRFVPVFDRRPRARPILWEQLRLPRLLRRAAADLVFSPGYSLPPRLTVPAVVTLHDLSFEHLPEEFPWKERRRRRLLARRAVRRAHRVLADTGEIARDLQRTYGLEPGKIGVVPLGVDSRRFSAGEEGDLACLEDLGVRPPYLLYLGSILPRRQLRQVIAAFAAAAPEHPQLRLVVAGPNRLPRPRDLDGWITGSGCGERVVRLEYAPEAALAALYRQATLSFYLSSYEGFGLPPLESLAAATPAVVSAGLALDDVWPDYPYRCASLERGDVTAVVQVALADDDARRAAGREGARRVAGLTWRRAAELLLREIERAVRP